MDDYNYENDDFETEDDFYGANFGDQYFSFEVKIGEETKTGILCASDVANAAQKISDYFVNYGITDISISFLCSDLVLTEVDPSKVGKEKD